MDEKLKRADLWSVSVGLWFLALAIGAADVVFRVIAGVLAVFALLTAIRLGSGRDRLVNGVQAVALIALAGGSLFWQGRNLPGGVRVMLLLAGVASLVAAFAALLPSRR